MRRTTAAKALLAAAILWAAASAAEAQRGYSWQGSYVGAIVGYQRSDVSRSPANPSGPAGGVQAGHNWQFGQFVFGAETDIQATGANDTFAPWKFSNPWFGTLRARGGVAMNNVLFYGTLGLAYGTLQAQSAASGVTETRMTAGWAAGAGLEIALMGNWTARAEYLYVDLDDRSFVLDASTHGIVSNLLRLGVSYRF
jgi:outer membrane immunogenic protein